MRVGILGSGLMGGKLGTIFARAGHEVVSAMRAARREAAREADALLLAVHWSPVDAGPLRIGRYAEPFALLLAQLAYEGKGGPELAYRFQRFGG